VKPVLDSLFASATDDFRSFMEQLFAVENIEPTHFFSAGYPTVIRVNTLKATQEEVFTELESKGFVLKKLPFPPEAIEIVEQPFPIAKTLPHILGWIYIQSLASMLPAMALKPEPGMFILDLAAAPGSKTTQIAALVNNRAAILANDISIERVKSLAHNVDRTGAFSVGISTMPGDRLGKILPENFNCILIDAPCSALGIVSKAQEVMTWWNLREVSRLAARQKQLLVSGIKALTPGGTLVYSTCTLTPQENEALLTELLKEYPIELEELGFPVIQHRHGLKSFGSMRFDPSLQRAVRLYPQEAKTEGFFIARIRKRDTMNLPSDPVKTGREEMHLYSADDEIIRPALTFLHNEFGISHSAWEHLLFSIKHNELWMVSDVWKDKPQAVTKRLGIKLARAQRGGRWKLSTSAAQMLKAKIAHRLLNLQTESEAIRFLRGENLTGQWENQGQTVVCWHGTILGVGVVHRNTLKSQVPKGRRAGN